MAKKANFRRTKLLRIVLVWSFSALLVLISLTYYNQYREYRKAERQMETLYSQSNTSTDDLNKLLSLIAQSENAFRRYSVEFDSSTFKQYTKTLDSIKQHIDSLALLPIQHNPFANTPADIASRNVLASEYATLKKTVEQLVQHTQDSLNTITTYLLPARLTLSDTSPPVATEPSADEEIVIVEQDTIVRKRRSLFRRIFNSRDDTIVVDVKTTRIAKAADPTETTTRSTTLISTQQADLVALRSSFARLQEKERELVNANYALLNSVRSGIEKIRVAKMNTDRLTEKQDFDRYRANTNLYNKQLVALLCLMLALVFILWHYIRRVTVNEAALENERRHVEKLAEEKSAILAGISHEIRTPLSSLLGTVDLIRNDADLYHGPRGENRKNILDSSYHHLVSINDTITDILNLSRLEAGSGEVENASFAPAETFRAVLELHETQAGAKGLELREDIQIDSGLTVIGNEFRVKQITSNLVGNAIKYTQTGHVLLSAKIVGSSRQTTLRISVKDTGIGIPAKHLPHVFRKYYTVDESKTSSGFGLGLYITKLLTDELAGTIKVSNETGKGTTFLVDIPLSGGERAQLATESPDDDLSLAALPEGIRYLIVDDNPVNLLFMKQFLAAQKHVETTQNPAAVLALLAEQPVDVIITDINMPGLNGWQLLDAIKASVKYPGVKILALSADTFVSRPQNNSGDTAAAFDGVIPKPFTEADFARSVLHALGSPECS